MKGYNTFGVMIDMSRNAVMRPEALKKFLRILKKMGYNCAMLYTEDTYEVDGEPYFGYMRGRYTKEEMKELDAFARGIGMELIPCIQTLAHLNAIKRWNIVPFDCKDILFCDDDRTYELIDHMFATLSQCFASRRIHIGMDEAHMLGLGKHKDIHGIESADVIMKRHLTKVCALAEKYGYETMIWSDMFFRPWNGGHYYVGETKIPKEYIDAMPSNVIPVYWDYYQTEQRKYSDMMKNHRQLSKNVWFAGGAYRWVGLIPYNQFTIDAMVPALDACRENKVKNVFFTMWGDDGAECSSFALLPSLFYLAEYAKGNRDETKMAEKFKRLVGLSFEECMAIDLPNQVVPYEGKPRNPSKYMLYADTLMDYLDYTVRPGAGERYKEFSAQLSATAKKSRTYGYLFDTAAKLCDVLAIKYELGLRTRRAYEAGDREALRALLADYTETVRRVKVFYRAFKKQWMRENKPQGFDVQEQRIGGLLLRLESCRDRISDYVNGRIDRIEELEEALLPYREKEESTTINRAPIHATTGLIYMSATDV